MPNKGTAIGRGLSILLALVDVGCHFLCFGLGCYHTTLVSVLIPSVGRSGPHPHYVFLLNFEILVFQMVSRSHMLH